MLSFLIIFRDTISIYMSLVKREIVQNLLLLLCEIWFILWLNNRNIIACLFQETMDCNKNHVANIVHILEK